MRSLRMTMAVVLLLAGCGGRAEQTRGPSLDRVRVILDYLPNAVHAGFYLADARGYFRDQGLQVRIDAPTSSSDTLRLMAAGQAEFGLVSLLDFLAVRAQGEPLKIVMAVEQRPLAALIALRRSGIERPKDLDGHLVGTTGVMSDEAGVRWMIQRDGGNPASVRLINIGFNTAQQIIAGNVDAAFGFWTQEGVQVAAHQPTTVMRLEDYGAPPYPELVVFAREDFLAREPGIVRRFLRAVTQGYDDTLSNPNAACAAMAEQVDGETSEGLMPYLKALLPVLRADAPAYGWLNLPVLREYLTWLRQIGVLDLRQDPRTFASNEFLPPIAGVPEGKK
jgi:putative hydroxymethylpyrimidine transport system substrate-binding protein